MNLEKLLSEKKSAIIENWFNRLIATYPAESSKFFKSSGNQFANPVGHNIQQGLEGIFSELMKNSGNEKISDYLDDIIRIRAVQDFRPSGALAFVFLLKNAIRDALGKELCENNSISADLNALESRIDDLSLLAFDVYMGCKEKIYEIKANEVRRMTFRLLQQANLLAETQENDVPENNSDIKRKEAAQ